MTQMNVAAELQVTLWIVVNLAAPALVGAMVVGLIVGVLQAVTQVQDQSLPIAAKLLMVAAIVLFASPFMVVSLVRQSERLFDTFAVLTR